MDPLLMPFGIIADAFQASGEIDEETQAEIGLAFGAAMGRNLASRSYLMGLQDFTTKMFSGDPEALEAYATGKTSGFGRNLEGPSHGRLEWDVVVSDR